MFEPPKSLDPCNSKYANTIYLHRVKYLSIPKAIKSMNNKRIEEDWTSWLISANWNDLRHKTQDMGLTKKETLEMVNIFLFPHAYKAQLWK